MSKRPRSPTSTSSEATPKRPAIAPRRSLRVSSRSSTPSSSPHSLFSGDTSKRSSRRNPVPLVMIVNDPYPTRTTSSTAAEYYDDDDKNQIDLRQRNAEKLGVRIHSPKQFGHIPGIPVGKVWEKRMHCSTDAVHAPTVAGISGNPQVGCWSVCLSGGYEDDFDNGDYFQYTGSGGRDLKGTKDQPKNLRTAPQSRDQSFTENKCNAALLKSVKTGKPIRVVRGFKAANRYAPSEGYVYCGLYRCEKAWMTRGLSGFQVCKFAFRRLPHQDPLPVFHHDLSSSSSASATSQTQQEGPQPSPTTEPSHPKEVKKEPEVRRSKRRSISNRR
ncbi:hypothetical protein ACQY0O_003819 [Thecaphora frezii]